MGLLDRLIQPHAALADFERRFSLDVSGASDAQVLGTLVTCFGADDDCTRIGVIRDGGLLGEVDRRTLLDAVDDGVKGVGSSDGMLLPGIANYSTSTWVCPIHGCGYTVMAIVLGDSPDCARHPHQQMVLKV